MDVRWFNMWYICIVYYSVRFPYIYVIYRCIITIGWIFLRDKLITVNGVNMWSFGIFSFFVCPKLKRPFIVLDFVECLFLGHLIRFACLPLVTWSNFCWIIFSFDLLFLVMLFSYFDSFFVTFRFSFLILCL